MSRLAEHWHIALKLTTKDNSLPKRGRQGDRKAGYASFLFCVDSGPRSARGSYELNAKIRENLPNLIEFYPLTLF